jgi:hypothetical protein
MAHKVVLMTAAALRKTLSWGRPPKKPRSLSLGAALYPTQSDPNVARQWVSPLGGVARSEPKRK